jgi:flagellar biosynthesis/type III secretory pathway protein FliH
MSSSDASRVLVSAWALDEFAAPDIFPALEENSRTTNRTADSAPSLSLEQIEQAAYERGYVDAERAATLVAEQRVASIVNALEEALESVRLHESRWMANLEENIAALAVGVARGIVAREVATDVSVVESLVQSALSQLPLDQTVTVRVSIEDHALLSAARASMIASGTRDIRWIADAQLQRGGCLVEGRERIIDGRVDTALERFYRAIGQVQA